MASNTTGGIGAGLQAFSTIFSRALFQKQQQDAAAKRQKEDDQRMVTMLGIKEILETNPGALADPERAGELLKGFGKIDPAALKQFSGLMTSLQGFKNAEAAQLAAANLDFDIKAGLVRPPTQTPTPAPATVPAPAPTAPVDTVGTAMHPGPDFFARANAVGNAIQDNLPLTPESAPAEQIRAISEGPRIPTPRGPATEAAGAATAPVEELEAERVDFGAPPTLSEEQRGRLHQIAGRARDIAIKSPDKRTTIKLDREADLEQFAAELRSGGMSYFDIARTFHQENLSSHLPPKVREAAGLQGFEQLLQREVDLVNSGKKQRLNLRNVMNTLEQQGLLVEPDERKKILQPIAKSLYAGNLRRILADREAAHTLIAQARRNGDTALEQSLINTIAVRPAHQALLDTFDQTDGRGFTEQMMAQLNNELKPNEALFAANMAVSPPGPGGTVAASERTADIERERGVKKVAEETAARERASFETGQELALGEIIPALQSYGNVFQRGVLMANEGNLTGAHQAFRLAKSILDSNATQLTRLQGQVGTLTDVDLEYGVSTFPSEFDAFKVMLTNKIGGIPEIDLRLSVIARMLSRKSGERVEIGGIGPEVVDAFEAGDGPPGGAPATTEDNAYLDSIGVK